MNKSASWSNPVTDTFKPPLIINYLYKNHSNSYHPFLGRMFKIWNKKYQTLILKKMTFLFEILLDEIVMNNAWRMKYCKSKCAEKQEVNSALLYESRLSDNTLLLISHRISLREKSLLLMCGFQKDFLRSRWSMNSESVIQKGEIKQERMSLSGTESEELLVIDDYLS